MGKADKMLLEQGFKKTEIKALKEGVVRVRYEGDFGSTIAFEHNIKRFYTSFSYIDIDLWLAINEKMKELGWFD